MISDLPDPGRQFRLKPEMLQLLKCFQINILCNVFPVFVVGDHFKNQLRYQAFCILYNCSKGIGVATQHLADQQLVGEFICSYVIHLLHQTGLLKICCKEYDVDNKIIKQNEVLNNVYYSINRSIPYKSLNEITQKKSCRMEMNTMMQQALHVCRVCNKQQIEIDQRFKTTQPTMPFIE